MEYESILIFYSIDTDDVSSNSKINSRLYSEISKELSNSKVDYEITIQSGSIDVNIILGSLVQGVISALAVIIINRILDKSDKPSTILVVADDKTKEELLQKIKSPKCIVVESKDKRAKSFMEKFSKFKERFSISKKKKKTVRKKAVRKTKKSVRKKEDNQIL